MERQPGESDEHYRERFGLSEAYGKAPSVNDSIRRPQTRWSARAFNVGDDSATTFKTMTENEMEAAENRLRDGARVSYENILRNVEQHRYLMPSPPAGYEPPTAVVRTAVRVMPHRNSIRNARISQAALAVFLAIDGVLTSALHGGWLAGAVLAAGFVLLVLRIERRVQRLVEEQTLALGDMNDEWTAEARSRFRSTSER